LKIKFKEKFNASFNIAYITNHINNYLQNSKSKMVCKGDIKWVWVNIYKHHFAKKHLVRHWTAIKVTWKEGHLMTSRGRHGWHNDFEAYYNKSWFFKMFNLISQSIFIKMLINLIEGLWLLKWYIFFDWFNLLKCSFWLLINMTFNQILQKMNTIIKKDKGVVKWSMQSNRTKHEHF
jgi:hypothetical protein